MEGRSFHILTDHKLLIFTLCSRSEKHSPWQARHIDVITQFNSDIRHIKSTSNSPAIQATQSSSPTDEWPNIEADIHRWTRSSIQWQRSKVQHHITTPLSTFSTPDARFDHVHIDIVGPLPLSKSYSYMLTCINWFTR